MRIYTSIVYASAYRSVQRTIPVFLIQIIRYPSIRGSKKTLEVYSLNSSWHINSRMEEGKKSITFLLDRFYSFSSESPRPFCEIYNVIDTRYRMTNGSDIYSPLSIIYYYSAGTKKFKWIEFSECDGSHFLREFEPYPYNHFLQSLSTIYFMCIQGDSKLHGKISKGGISATGTVSEQVSGPRCCSASIKLPATHCQIT